MPPKALAANCPPVLNHRVVTLLDKPVDLCAHAGKVVLVVNTASQCGYTSQYEGLERLARKYRDRGLVVLGFPANDFGSQEPGSNKQIAAFCQVNYGVSFPMFAKSQVVGSNALPLFAQLAQRGGGAPQWNFHKYLIDRRGERVIGLPSAIDPTSPALTNILERMLAESDGVRAP